MQQRRLAPRLVDGRFVNPSLGHDRAAQEGGLRDFLKWRRERVAPPKTFFVPRVDRSHHDLAPPEQGARATWVGHSTVLLQLDGRTYLTDPVWSERIGFGTVRRKTPPGIPWAALPHIDAVLLSHNHYDHLDLPTLGRLPRDTPILCPTGVGALLRAKKFRHVEERSWWETARVDGHRATLVPAQHFSGRTLLDRDRSLWGGWVIEGDAGATAYYAGDTGYFQELAQVGDAFPRLDLAIVPIGAYEPRWFMSPVHVDPPEAGQTFLDVGARAMMPVHYGTFQLADEPLDAPPSVLRAWWRERGLDEARLLIPPLGGTVDAPPR